MLRSEEKMVFLNGVPCKQVCWIDVSAILPRTQPRHGVGAASGDEQPLTVRATAQDGVYELIAGERTLRALRRAGITQAEAIVMPEGIHEGELGELIVSLASGRLHYFEEAEGYARAIREFKLSQEELAARVGRSQSSIANKLRLLRLEEPVREVLRSGRLGERHARALLRLTSPQDRLQIARQAAECVLSVRDTEALVERAVQRERGALPAGQGGRKVIPLVRDHRLYLNAIRGIVSQMKASGVQADCTLRDLGDRVEMQVTVPRRRLEAAD